MARDADLSGLALRLAGETEPRGAHLEDLVLMDLQAWRDGRTGAPQVLYWRTYDGREVDFVLENHGGVVAVEVKATTRPRPRDWATLIEFRDVCDSCRRDPGRGPSPRLRWSSVG